MRRMEPETGIPTRENMLRDLGYSETAIRHLNERSRFRSMPSPTSVTEHRGACGDELRLYLSVTDGIIRDASFELVGCAGAEVCASALTSMVTGVTLDAAGRFAVSDIIRYLGGIPAAKEDCAEFAIDTLRHALEDLS